MTTRKRRSRKGSSDKGEFWFDEDDARIAVEFIETLCRHWKGEFAGRPFILAEWQRERIVRPLFGWKRADGSRKYRTVYVEVPKKNGKSTLAAAVALLLLFWDREEGGEIYSAAAERRQAEIVFRDARQMVLQSQSLTRRSEILRRVILAPKTNSRYEVISADAGTKHGYNPSGIIFDELHTQPNRDLWDTLTMGGGTRRQPVTFAITTAGWDTSSICYEVHDYAVKVADGVIEDPSFLPVIYGAEADEDWTDPAVWAKANPGLGISVKEDFLREECRKALESPARQNAFRRLFLDQWTEQLTRWFSTQVWNENGGAFDLDALKGRAAFGGLDLSSTQDVTAFVLVFPPKDPGEKWKIVPKFWIPQSNVAERVRRDRVPFDAWIREGWVEATPGNTIDYDRVRNSIVEMGKTYRIREIAFDRWGAAQIQTQLQADGFTIAEFGQGFASMSPAAKEFEKLLLGRELAHGRNPVLDWMASNVQVQVDAAENVKPIKVDRRKRIDGIVAAVMAIGRAAASPKIASIYETRGVLVLGGATE
jgi:phage terminase large subunit-like protein